MNLLHAVKGNGGVVMDTRFQQIAAQLRLPGRMTNAMPLAGGRVNETYRVRFRCGESETDYVFQRLNETAFPEPERMMQNITLVTAHLAAHSVPVRQYYCTDLGNPLVYTDGFWRVTDYVEGITYSSTEDPSVIAEMGRAFGAFLRHLSDFDYRLLHETIPDFHHTRKRLDTFFLHACRADTQKLTILQPFLERLAVLRTPASQVHDCCRETLPMRVTHNDTKCSNVLFDPDKQLFQMVIDLDTVMPGFAAYDFGDAVRSICTVQEGTQLCMSRFSHFAKGYLAETSECLSPAESAMLAPAAMAVTVELAARYCDDWLMQTGYFQVNRPNGQLQRAAELLTLAEDLHRKLPEMQRLLRSS